MNASAQARFETKYEVSSLGCWSWKKPNSRGYGYFRLDGKLSPAHRVSYEHHIGPIAEGLTIDHLCRNRSCVNPLHLEPVSMKVNLLRSENPPSANAKKQACKHGHEFDADNTYGWEDKRGRTHRSCKTCLRNRHHQVRST